MRSEYPSQLCSLHQSALRCTLNNSRIAWGIGVFLSYLKGNSFPKKCERTGTRLIRPAKFSAVEGCERVEENRKACALFILLLYMTSQETFTSVRGVFISSLSMRPTSFACTGQYLYYAFYLLFPFPPPLTSSTSLDRNCGCSSKSECIMSTASSL